MTEVYISFMSPLANCSRDDIEDELARLLDGRGFITGSGGSLAGEESNIDLELPGADPTEIESLVEEIVQLLRNCGVPADTVLSIRKGDDQKELPIYTASVPSQTTDPPPSIKRGDDSRQDIVDRSVELLLQPGDLISIPVLPNLNVVCKVIKTDPSRTHPFLVTATKWLGSGVPSLQEPALAEPLILTMLGAIAPYRAWIRGDLPVAARKIGTVPLSHAENEADSTAYKQWSLFVHNITEQWKWESSSSTT
jgi:hypothetical protein